MKLLLFRHGPAGDKDAWAKAGKADAERPLTREGRSKTAKAAKGLARAAKTPGVLACSPLTRAVQTADLLAAVMPKAKRLTLPELSPEAPIDDLISRLRVLGSRAGLALVGHEPQLSRLASELIVGGSALRLELKKAGACLLEFEAAPERGRGELLWLLTPRQLRALAGR